MRKVVSSALYSSSRKCPVRKGCITYLRFYSSTSASTKSNRFEELDNYQTDEVTNLTDSIRSKLGRNLHKQAGHPLNIIKTKIENYFDENHTNPPFAKYDSFSPIVTSQQNFDELLVPKDHIARSPNDSYYVNSTHLLRPQTSAHQTTLLRKKEKAFLVTGDVYRRDTVDATHYPVFHQMEGVRLWSEEESATIDDEVVRKDMQNTLEQMISHVFKDVGGVDKMRWIDAYFPFTHPSWELEIFFNNNWLEVLGCGVIHKNIMRNCELSKQTGWAVGLGLERLAMVLFQIPDIRLFWSEDKRFLNQFTPGKVSKFQSYSKYPECTKDIAFWVTNPNFHENDLFDLVRSEGSDFVESVTLVDKFVHPKKNMESRCYRIFYRSMDRNLTNDEVNVIQERVRSGLSKLGLEIR